MLYDNDVKGYKTGCVSDIPFQQTTELSEELSENMELLRSMTMSVSKWNSLLSKTSKKRNVTKSIPSMSTDAKVKLAVCRPHTIGAASGIPGMTPAAIVILLKHVKYKHHNTT
ncbi:Mitochondrial Translation Optimization [Mactra antiquata]